MGCGASKGKTSEKEAKIEFKDIGVGSMDDFFTKCKELLTQFSETTNPLDDAKEEFFASSEFVEVPGSSMCHFISKFTF